MPCADWTSPLTTTLLVVPEVSRIASEPAPLTLTLFASMATKPLTLLATMPALSAPVVVTVPVLKISTSPTAAIPWTPGLLSPGGDRADFDRHAAVGAERRRRQEAEATTPAAAE